MVHLPLKSKQKKKEGRQIGFDDGNDSDIADDNTITMTTAMTTTVIHYGCDNDEDEDDNIGDEDDNDEDDNATFKSTKPQHTKNNVHYRSSPDSVVFLPKAANFLQQYNG